MRFIRRNGIGMGFFTQRRAILSLKYVLPSEEFPIQTIISSLSQLFSLYPSIKTSNMQIPYTLLAFLFLQQTSWTNTTEFIIPSVISGI